MVERIRFLFNRMSERLWIRPLLMCVLSIALAFLARAVDNLDVGDLLPEITPDSIETLLSILSSSMLVIATFAVASMVAAYASASNTATPRAFPLIISDDVSQNALSTFIGAFIFSIVALIAMMNSYYDKAGRFALFVLTLSVFVIVIITFVRWVDRIARLGRLGATIDKVERATASSMRRYRHQRSICKPSNGKTSENSSAVYGSSIGYVQRVDMDVLQSYAQEQQLNISVAALPGTFLTPQRILAHVMSGNGAEPEFDNDRITGAFVVGDDRIFDEDPRFGLIVLAEIASRALSPAVNDAGTAIDIIGTLVRLFSIWCENEPNADQQKTVVDRVAFPEILVADMFDDAFTPIARDGAGLIEVVIRLQKALEALAQMDDNAMRESATSHARLSLLRAEKALPIAEDLKRLQKLLDLAE